jgi:phosphoribosylformylglycinamidine cyclo-ligase
MRYKDAGVDIEKLDSFKSFLKGLSREIGKFGGIFPLSSGYKNPVLCASTDGVGTKLMLTNSLKVYNTVGEDLVNHCVNDIIVEGAYPLFFMDYVGASFVDTVILKEIMNGIARGCMENGLTLLGGETAELPGLYKGAKYDLVGFIVGIIEKEKVIDGSKIRAGDTVIGLKSNGLHTNGYSLVRKVIEEREIDLNIPFGEGKLWNELLRIHRSYKRLLLPLFDKINGMAHITGGGFYGNIPRVLPKGLGVKIYQDSWEVPPIFEFIQKEGEIEKREMFRVFNMGIGMVLMVRRSEAEEILKGLGEGMVIGEVVEGRGVEIV